MTLHIVVGPPCAGKSTFVENNAPVGVPRFDFDHITKAVAGGDVGHEAPTAVVDTVFAMRRGLMGWMLDEETRLDEFWFVVSSPTQSSIERFVQLGAEFHLIDPGLEECLARAERAGEPASVLERIRNWYAAPPVLPDTKGGELLRLKDVSVSVKSDSTSEGEIIAYASVFNNVDAYGDIVLKGAFEETLSEWKESGNTIPLLYGHDFRDPFSNIGSVLEASEDDHGLKVHASLDLDNPKAAQVYRLLKEKRLNQMSFAFDVVEGAFVEREKEDVYEIRRAKLYEVSVVPIGANQETEVLAVKAGKLPAHTPDADGVGVVGAVVDAAAECEKQHELDVFSMRLALLNDWK